MALDREAARAAISAAAGRRFTALLRDTEMATKYLFLSAGSGITPLMSMTRTLYDLGSDADVLFIHNARTPADIIFRRELDAIASMTPNIRVVHICEGDCLSEPWGGLRGRLSTAALEAIAPDLMDRVTFTCGPSAYMESVRKILTETGYDMRNYHEESFTFESLPRPTRSAVDADRELPTYGSPLADETPALFVGGSQETAVYSVEFVRSGLTIDCSAARMCWTLRGRLASRRPPPAVRACVEHARPR